jgi:hypothetical protein
MKHGFNGSLKPTSNSKPTDTAPLLPMKPKRPVPTLPIEILLISYDGPPTLALLSVEVDECKTSVEVLLWLRYKTIIPSPKYL